MMTRALLRILQMNLYSQNMKTKIKSKNLKKVDIVTYEFENIPVNVLEEIEKEKVYSQT